jgi:hypothetical protein
MITENAKFIEQAKIAACLASTTPSTTTPRRVSLKGYERATVIIYGLNATTVTGSAITLLQATDIANANSDEKAVAFTEYWTDLDVGAGDGLTVATASNNTFTTLTTNSKEYQYVIEVTPDMLDINNGFDCLRVGTANAVATTLSVEIILWSAKYGKTPPVAIDPEAN